MRCDMIALKVDVERVTFLDLPSLTLLDLSDTCTFFSPEDVDLVCLFSSSLLVLSLSLFFCTHAIEHTRRRKPIYVYKQPKTL